MEPEYVRLEAMKLAVGVMMHRGAASMPAMRFEQQLAELAAKIEDYIWSGAKKSSDD